MIRPATPDDARAIAELHVRVWGTHGRPAGAEVESYAAHFRRVFLENPWFDPEVAPLVNSERDGRISGLLGVVVRPMLFRGRRVRMAVSSEFAVDPALGSPLVGLQLLQRFLNGPQELSFADAANDRSAQLWERLGGTLAPLYSLSWIRPLRLCRLGVRLLGRRRVLQPVSAVAGPVAGLLDAIAAWFPQNPLVPVNSGPPSVKLAPDVFAGFVSEVASADLLRPDYDHVGVQWLWGRLDGISRCGDVHAAAVPGPDGRTSGCFVYQMQNGAADVLYVAARDRAAGEVLETLFRHAYDRGAHSATGRLHPRWLGVLSQHRCLFHRRGGVSLVHARDRELADCFVRGDAFVSRLEGERSLAHVA